MLQHERACLATSRGGRPPQRSRRRPLGLLIAFALFISWARADYPIASHRYLADPAALVHDGRVYLYCSNDDENTVTGNYVMKSLVCVSSSDLKNWTDHGVVFRVPADASWASYAWAPAVIARNGKFYLYFGNSASGIGVASSTSPTGPFTDAKGGYLINSATPGVLPATDMWIFDPAVFVDEDGQAYLYFGGNGVNNARVIKLNADMVSTSGAAVTITTPNFFEAAWMHKRNGLYYFSYSANPGSGLTIDYLTSTEPMANFTYRGTVAGQPPSNNNNNHHAIFAFNGAWYHVYHNRFVAAQAGIPPGYRRNLGLERLEYNVDGTIQGITYTTDGVVQLGTVNSYVRVEAETLNGQSGIETEPCSDGGMDVVFASDGAWTRIKGVDFGLAGAGGFTAKVASANSGGTLEIRLGSPTGVLVGTCFISGTGGSQVWTTQSCQIAGATGIQDVYLKFKVGSSNGLSIDWWRFDPASAPSGPPATFVNIATRAYCSTGNNVTIGGFVISGNTSKRVLVRAVGPSLTAQGLGTTEVLLDPSIKVHDARHDNAVVAMNDNVGDNANAGEIASVGATIGAAPLLGSDTKSAALLVTLAPGVYTFVAQGQGATSGIVLIEVYDADAAPSGSTFANIASRAYCTTNNGVTIGGFVISGTRSKQVLMRAVGPTLVSQGIGQTEVLVDPKIELHDANHGNALVAINDDWGDNANAADIRLNGARIGAAPFDQTDTKSSALLLTLQPGVYTFVASGKAGSSGIVLVEVYDAD